MLCDPREHSLWLKEACWSCLGKCLDVSWGSMPASVVWLAGQSKDMRGLC